MNTHRCRAIVLLFPLLTAIAISTAFAASSRITLKQHPKIKNEDLRTCTICHQADESFAFGRFNHTILFAEKHGAAARGSLPVCQMCHTPRACTTCHHTGIGLKPESKIHGDPRPRTPHRGDYLTRHRFDGHLDPTSCFHCHGRPKTARRCRQCHH